MPKPAAKCRECKGPRSRQATTGLCQRCYHNARRQKPQDEINCIDCGRTRARTSSPGRCWQCYQKSRKTPAAQVVVALILELGSYSAAARVLGTSRQLAHYHGKRAGITEEMLQPTRMRLRKAAGHKCPECGFPCNKQGRLCGRCYQRTRRGKTRYDLTGRRIGYLRVVSLVWSEERQRSMWLCLCDCGRSREMVPQPLYLRTVESCGLCRPQVGSLRYRILQFVRDHGPCSVSQVARAMNLDSQRAGAHLGHLSKDGQVKHKKDGAHRRHLYFVNGGS